MKFCSVRNAQGGPGRGESPPAAAVCRVQAQCTINLRVRLSPCIRVNGCSRHGLDVRLRLGSTMDGRSSKRRFGTTIQFNSNSTSGTLSGALVCVSALAMYLPRRFADGSLCAPPKRVDARFDGSREAKLAEWRMQRSCGGTELRSGHPVRRGSQTLRKLAIEAGGGICE